MRLAFLPKAAIKGFSTPNWAAASAGNAVGGDSTSSDGHGPGGRNGHREPACFRAMVRVEAEPPSAGSSYGMAIVPPTRSACPAYFSPVSVGSMAMTCLLLTCWTVEITA